MHIEREREREGVYVISLQKNATIDPKNAAILFCVTIATCRSIAMFF